VAHAVVPAGRAVQGDRAVPQPTYVLAQGAELVDAPVEVGGACVQQRDDVICASVRPAAWAARTKRSRSSARSS
jgi:hypothetical protein